MREPTGNAACVAELGGICSGQEAKRPGDATNAPGHDTEEVTSMPDKRTPFAEQIRPIIAAAMDDGWTTGDLRDAFEQVAEFERDERMHREAKRLYGPAAKSMDSTPSAVAIVAKAKLPRGQYAITGPNEMAPVHKGSAIRAVEAALASSETCRLYRLADGWRFVGIIQADGRFVDERAS